MPDDHSKRILVVDDEDDIRKLIRTVLSMRGLQVDEAPNGATALSLIRENRYGVVLLDLFMPEMDGFQVLRELHADDMQTPPVVLVVTGADKRSIEELDSQRIHGVVRKPFDPEDLASLVVACSEIKGGGSFGTMAIATVISGAHIVQWLWNR